VVLQWQSSDRAWISLLPSAAVRPCSPREHNEQSSGEQTAAKRGSATALRGSCMVWSTNASRLVCGRQLTGRVWGCTLAAAASGVQGSNSARAVWRRGRRPAGAARARRAPGSSYLRPRRAPDAGRGGRRAAGHARRVRSIRIESKFRGRQSCPWALPDVIGARLTRGDYLT